MNPWLQFVERWRDCTACALCEGRQRVVLARGEVPCDVLFVGEAPGESEDCLGQPFVGPAGQLLDRIINRALPEYPPPERNHQYAEKTLHGRRNLKVAFTNLVCCIPRDEDGGKSTEPDDESIRACSVRLVEFVELANPKLIVCVGKLAKDWLDPGWKHSIKIHKPLVDVEIYKSQKGTSSEKSLESAKKGKSIWMTSITHPAAILRASVVQQGLLVQRCVVKLRNAVEEL